MAGTLSFERRGFLKQVNKPLLFYCTLPVVQEIEKEFWSFVSWTHYGISYTHYKHSWPHYLLCSSISGLSILAGSISSMFPDRKLAHTTCLLGSNPFSAPSTASTIYGVKRKNMLCVMLRPSTRPTTARTRSFTRSICLEVLLTREAVLR